MRATSLLLASVMVATVLGAPAGAQPGAVAPAAGDPSYVQTLPGDVVDLTGGGSRVDRMRAVAALEPSDHAMITTADAFPDALASGVLQDDAMLVGVSGGQLDPATQSLLESSDVSRVTVLGGVNAVPETVVQGFGSDVQVDRVSGAERTATAVEIARAADPSPDVVLLARARGPENNPSAGFIDAIGAGAWAAATGHPVLLIENDAVAPHTAQVIAELDPRRIIAVGGTAAISDATLSQAAAGRPTERVAGAERIATAAAVAHAMRPDGASTIFLVDGTDPDAWTSGFASARPAALRDGVILLTDGDVVPPGTADAIAQLEPSSIHCLATITACLSARAVAGLGDAATIQATPAPGQLLTAGSRVELQADGPVTVLDDGDCLVDGVRVGDMTRDCTIVVQVQGTGRAAGVTATLTWPAVVTSATQTAAAREYTFPMAGGRWDFDDALDVRTDADLAAVRGAYLDTDRSALIYGADPGMVPILWAGYGGAVPVAPDGLAVPLDSSSFDKMVIRFHSPQAANIAVEWRSCNPITEINCIMPLDILGRGYASAWTEPGWQTITLDMAASPGWANGPIHTMYLSAPAGTIVDDVRVTDGTPTTPIAVDTSPGTTLVWDTDDDPSNNTDATSTTWGFVEGGTLDPDVLPPGEYYLHTTTGAPTVAGATTGPVRILPGSAITTPPPPAAEWARDVRGNPWDFAPGGLVAGTDDIIEMGNATRVDGPGLTAVNSNGSGDPHIMLDVPVPIDSNAWRTVTVNFSVEGGFNLGYDAGGGTHGRIMYQHGHNTPWRDGNDIVAYPSQTSYTIDMTSLNAVEPGTPAWNSAPVTGLRFDPNEDPGAGRRWTVTSIELTP